MFTLSSYDLGMDTYHHGDLRNALLEAVGDIIEEKGIGAVSLREAARRLTTVRRRSPRVTAKSARVALDSPFPYARGVGRG